MDFRQVPRTRGGKQIGLSSLFPRGYQSCFTGSADDIGNDTTDPTRWAGADFAISQNGAGTPFVEYRFFELVYLAGGKFSAYGGKFGDHISYLLKAPFNAAIETNNPGAGEYAKLDTGNGVLYVPAGTPGAGAPDYDLDLAAKLHAKSSITKASPVSVVDRDNPNGSFDWDSTTGQITKNMDGKGAHHLFDAEKVVGKFVIKARLVKDSDIDLIVPAIEPMPILPHWVHRVELNKAGNGVLDFIWLVYVGRKNTV